LATNMGRKVPYAAVHNYRLPGGFRAGTMTNAMAAFGIAVGGASLIFHALMARLQNRKRIRRSSGDGSSASDSATYATGDGWTMASWFGGGHSGTHGFGNSMDGLGNPIEFGGGSDFGGGDGGGGGGGAGGGGGD
jgi:hypothetical protein